MEIGREIETGILEKNINNNNNKEPRIFVWRKQLNGARMLWIDFILSSHNSQPFLPRFDSIPIFIQNTYLHICFSHDSYMQAKVKVSFEMINDSTRFNGHCWIGSSVWMCFSYYCFFLSSAKKEEECFSLFFYGYLFWGKSAKKYT